MTSYRNSDPRPAIMQGSPPQLVPPRMDWDRPPWNRWAFQNIRQILPTAEVWRGDAPVRALPRQEQDLDALPVASIKGAVTTLARLLDDTYTDGFIVLKDGAVVYERYFNGMTPRTLHLSQSVAKSVTAAAAGVLVGKGLLDVNAPVTHYIPELNDTAYRGALLQHVLDMRSGVTFDETYTDPHSDVGQLDVSSGWKPVPPGADAAAGHEVHAGMDRGAGADFHVENRRARRFLFALLVGHHRPRRRRLDAFVLQMHVEHAAVVLAEHLGRVERRQ